MGWSPPAEKASAKDKQKWCAAAAAAASSTRASPACSLPPPLPHYCRLPPMVPGCLSAHAVAPLSPMRRACAYMQATQHPWAGGHSVAGLDGCCTDYSWVAAGGREEAQQDGL
jgi:hypothetical protein